MSTQDLIIYVIAGIILVGSWVVNLIRKQAEENEQTGQSSSRSAAGSKPRLDELAARRREELRRLAKEGGGKVQTSARQRPGAGEPANLTMAERIARARAKAQYDKRAQELGQPADGGGSSQPQPQPKPQPTASQPAPAPAGGGREEQGAALEMERARQRELQRREAELRQRREAERRAQAQRERERRKREQERQRAQEAAERRRREAEAASAQRRGRSSGRRTVERQSAYALKSTSAAPRGLPFTQRSLREAVVLREVFDRPIAMRDPVADRMF